MGPAEAEKVPYYLLIVGAPSDIPYHFQYQLDVQYAVGRLHFATMDEYAQYARSVVMAETGSFASPRRVAFVGVSNPDDKATNMSRNQLVIPLANYLAKDRKKAPAGQVGARTFPDWEVETLLDDGAKKASLQRLLGGDQTPALLFTASHGMGFPKDHPLQLSHQGALICQDWDGPRAGSKGPISQDNYLAADDIADNANLLGLIAFHFACYGAGTPELDDFSHIALKAPAAIAPHPFVARLPQRMLGHPNGGALAVLGHVERAWGYSFMTAQAGPQHAVYESTFKRLLEGHPVGSAIEYFNERYAAMSTSLTAKLDNINKGIPANPRELDAFVDS